MGGANPIAVSSAAYTKQLRRKNRLANIVSQTHNLAEDEYFSHNHMGQIQCKLCGTVHRNEASYVTHVKGSRHARCLRRHKAFTEKKQKKGEVGVSKKQPQKEKIQTIGVPAFEIFHGSYFENQIKRYFVNVVVEFPHGDYSEQKLPMFRILSTYEQNIVERDSSAQLLIICQVPYKPIAVKIPRANLEGCISDVFDSDTNEYRLRIVYPQDFTLT
ncbi:hypothetical protein PCE1_004069 [Barthelona sp. PCE]